MSLRLRPVETCEFDLVRHIQVEPEQVLFCGTVAQAFEQAEDGVDFHAIFLREMAIGFFKIDQAYGLTPDLTPSLASGRVPARDLGLRGFMIDRNYQNQRHATKALRALPGYLLRHYPGTCNLALTVDLQNFHAIRLYRKNGFTETQELHFGGLFGIQRVMRMPLRVSA